MEQIHHHCRSTDTDLLTVSVSESWNDGCDVQLFIGGLFHSVGPAVAKQRSPSC